MGISAKKSGSEDDFSLLSVLPDHFFDREHPETVFTSVPGKLQETPGHESGKNRRGRAEMIAREGDV
jgi:hypothetical protein